MPGELRLVIGEGACPFCGHAPVVIHDDANLLVCPWCERVDDVFSWIMKRDGVTFAEALEFLRERLAL